MVLRILDERARCLWRLKLPQGCATKKCFEIYASEGLAIRGERYESSSLLQVDFKKLVLLYPEDETRLWTAH